MASRASGGFSRLGDGVCELVASQSLDITLALGECCIVLNLSGSPAIDTALGLVVLFFLLSTVASSINEAIASVLGWRAKTLEDGVRSLLGDPAPSRRLRVPGQVKKGATDLTSAVLGSPRIQRLVRVPGSSVRRKARPSYLDASTFSLALVETLADGPPASSSDSSTMSAWQKADTALFRTVNAELANLPAGPVKSALIAVTSDASASIEAYRKDIEGDFDAVMQRASGWYKRKTQLMIGVIAALTAVGLNVNTVKIANSLWTNPPLRAAVASVAGKETSIKDARKAVEQIDALKLPVGWGAGNAPKRWGWLLSVPGWLITIAAISLGAPFWFDLLSRFANLRGSGTPPG